MKFGSAKCHIGCSATILPKAAFTRYQISKKKTADPLVI
jgi:hypothetical protein